MPRAILIGPVVFTLVGTLGGVAVAMLRYQQPLERVHVYLDDSLPVAAGGAVLGGLAGVGVMAACERWPRLRRWATVGAASRLAAGIGAPLGWIVGDAAFDDRVPRTGMALGAALGVVVGGLIGLTQAADARSTAPNQS